ncbi:MAG: tripartite tricarboxylate transporter substrate binding protein [Burkholderiales bacterium]|nr:tripartite tricarboxylate transporter substrate binding protein [Burkholderiales bacterium]
MLQVGRLFQGLVVFCALLLAAASDAQPAGYPARSVTYVVPYPAGGAADVFARSLAAELGKRLGQPVIVENRAGANGNVGSAFVARSAPADGYTLLLGSLSTLAINPHIYSSMGYDPLKDLQPVSLTHQMANVLVVNPATQYKTVAELIAAAKARPGALSYASAGNGNTMHIAAEQFKAQSGIDIAHIPYKGGPPALNDVLGGQVPMMFNNLPAIVELVNAGKLRALAVGDARRARQLPQVPTMEEAGLKGYSSIVWNGVLVRAGMPPDVVQYLAKQIAAALESPALRKPLEDQGFEVLSSTPEKFAALIRSEHAAMAPVVKASGAKLD